MASATDPAPHNGPSGVYGGRVTPQRAPPSLARTVLRSLSRSHLAVQVPAGGDATQPSDSSGHGGLTSPGFGGPADSGIGNGDGPAVPHISRVTSLRVRLKKRASMEKRGSTSHYMVGTRGRGGGGRGSGAPP